jgi:hypothetical protein
MSNPKGGQCLSETPYGSWFMVYGFGVKVRGRGSRFGGWSVVIRVGGSGLRIQGLGFGVQTPLEGPCGKVEERESPATHPIIHLRWGQTVNGERVDRVTSIIRKRHLP